MLIPSAVWQPHQGRSGDTGILIALADGRLHVAGDPSEVLTEECVRTVFGLDSQVIPDPTSGKPLMLPIGRHHVLTR